MSRSTTESLGADWLRVGVGRWGSVRLPLRAWMPRNCRWRIQRPWRGRSSGWLCGEVVHLVRDGRVVADLVPAGTDSRAARAQHAAPAITRRMADRFGAPTLAHYRRVYESCGQPWPGDEQIRRRFPVADAS